MPSHNDKVTNEISKLANYLINEQKSDGSWRYCFENGTIIDSYMIILLRSINSKNELIIQQLHNRIVAQQHLDGYWSLYKDEEKGNLSATIDAYYALLYSGYSKSTEDFMQRAKQYIISQGGLGASKGLLSNAVLAATGQIKWPTSIKLIPLEIILLPTIQPINIFQFSGYSRVHLIPMLIMSNQSFSIQTGSIPNLSDLQSSRIDAGEHDSIEFTQMIEMIELGRTRLIGSSRSLHDIAMSKAEQYMLDRIEADGTLYSYASSTILMVFSLLALGYDKKHPTITSAVQGLIDMRYITDEKTTIQNSPSTVWDTALITYALQEAGVKQDQLSIRKAGQYLLLQQQHNKGDWSLHNASAIPGGWGFSESNTLNPDVDDTTAALRAIQNLSINDPAYLESINLGLNWALSMQNKDGGWPAFEKNTNNKMLTWLALDGAKSAAIDPSDADLTGRTLEYLGNFRGLTDDNKSVKKGVDWLFTHQERNGSWYGRWGVCYIYGTWAAITGLMAIGTSSNHKAIQKADQWLLSIQNSDGGWGESCNSDIIRRYVPLRESTPSQTAWALDALIAVHDQPIPEIKRGIDRLLTSIHESNWLTTYPTGAGLPGNFYNRYHSYRYIWPLVTLAHYKKKYGGFHS
ncbi:terpene cyclase/mutase family protein [Paenibacillus endoradicis]|uniref:terpene cyclase/mutase family protein n=1 Tax=Paenibacillus endoradicis TaxID=2972487 RepID=UPI00215942E8|nr:prenyltransferase/squalene oxidase repeat-containing protein [Paenibacillus endoradicis]MCR8656230.1 squalene--hopene cyclase [Paenibacillus endoradicis]